VKRLVVFSHKLFRRTPDGFQTTGGFTIQMDALSPYFERVTLCVPVVDDAAFRGVGITRQNICLHPLPNYRGRMDFLRSTPSIRRGILTALKHADLALIIMPGYVGMLASILCQRRGFPIFQWVVGDWGQNVRARRHNPLTRWWVSTTWTPLLDRLTMRLTRDVLTFYNGRILYKQGKPYHFIRVSSSIREGDFYTREDTAPTPPHRLLFVGRLSPEKGVSYLLKATALLAAKGKAVELHVVGTGSSEEELSQRAQALSITSHVYFHGFVPHGKTLRQLYRESDVFILPSLQDQQPKVLMEAMSQSLPVVATNVGGIPSIIQDGKNGLLVPPARPEAIAAAIDRVLSDDELYRRLVSEGLAHVRAHTVEQETARMMQIVADNFHLRGFRDEASTR
jgi:glycosyltransferase involved in cell wall biosynthesis